ncbi:MAG: chemotaxis protein CheA [Myxococcota bacterium]
MAARRRTPRVSKAQREFVSEAEDLLERLRQGLSDLGEAGEGGADPDLVNQLFRSAHSLKGLSGMFGFDALAELSHRLEDALDDLRMGRARVDGPVLPLIEESVAAFTAALAELGRGGDLESVAEATLDLRRRLEEARGVLSDAAIPALDVDESMLRALTEYEEHRLQENLRRGRRIHLVEACFEITSFDEGLQELSGAIREVGEVLSTLPSPGDTPESQIRFSILVAADVEPEDLTARLELSGGSVRGVGGGLPSEAPSRAQAASRPSPPAARPSGVETGSLRSLSDTVRVDIRKLEDLMNLVGEIGIHRGSLGALAARMARDPATAQAGGELLKIHRALERKLQELQAGVLEVRMVPLRQVFEKLSRVVRRLRKDLSKEVRLEVRGADTELDKLIVEQLVDPLVHLLRNAFDHAIEASEERLAAGKNAEGRIGIDASQRGNHVVIQVRDDGRGIDPERVRARAIEQGVLGAEQSPSRAECLELIFEPGLSTCEAVTETSGRGVGMDIVRSNLQAMGGVVEVDSTQGRGTTFTLTLPITLAIIQALLVTVTDQTFAVPVNSVLETVSVADGQLQRSERRELLNLRGEPVPVLRLARVFELEERAGGGGFAVVVGLGESKAALLVDRLEGQRDAVIKAIQGPIPQVRGIAGATEQGDRGAILVLDVSALVDDLAHRREAA